eukprot:CAMPEP_0196591652 /NCGR_PEP_ID=MMETSP1081-20130531/70447_1 /TAXON_ID=36882 /ORGANISM="Pyramimonas amylifera, Strain CCMP720" /LENGTH=254 /DNA_ID=CAMNT_0041915079 /DNA_START=255 /DNA_END=1019 /DNA_ORIENTATION=-
MAQNTTIGSSEGEGRTVECVESPELIFRQLWDHLGGSSTFTYLLADPATKEAMLIDPVLEMVDRDIELVSSLGLTLKLCLNTHMHADHVTGSGEIKKRLPGVKSVIAQASGAQADVYVSDGNEVSAGAVRVAVRATPGHTEGCVTYVTPLGGGMAFTGDALFIQGCGRTDFQGGDAGTLYESVHHQIFSLPETYKIYPGHEYKGRTSSTVLLEKTQNPRLTKNKEEFIEVMNNLNLPPPKKLDVAVVANRRCGL